jgi:hypothetical protein
VVAEALFVQMKVQRATKLTGASERLAALVAAAPGGWFVTSLATYSALQVATSVSSSSGEKVRMRCVTAKAERELKRLNPDRYSCPDADPTSGENTTVPQSAVRVRELQDERAW